MKRSIELHIPNLGSFQCAGNYMDTVEQLSPDDPIRSAAAVSPTACLYFLCYITPYLRKLRVPMRVAPDITLSGQVPPLDLLSIGFCGGFGNCTMIAGSLAVLKLAGLVISWSKS